MVSRIGGFRRKTRKKLRKPVSERGKFSLTKFFQQFDKDDKVVLKADPSYQRGMYFPRFHGRSGVVQESQGNCYKVKINDKGKQKLVVVHPIHMRKLN